MLRLIAPYCEPHRGTKVQITEDGIWSTKGFAKGEVILQKSRVKFGRHGEVWKWVDLEAGQQRRNTPIQVRQKRLAFIRSHNETRSVVAMRINNADRSPVGIIAEAQPQLQLALLIVRM